MSDIKIGIIGAGMIGGTLADLWSRSGFEVLVSSRNPERISAPEGVKVGTIEQAASFGEVVLLAIPFGAVANLSPEVKEQLKGRIVLDAGNPIPGRDGEAAAEVFASGQGSASWTAAQLPGAHVVKAFNTVYFRTMQLNYEEQQPIAVPLASDDPEAIQVAAELVSAAGLSPVVAGGLETSARFDPGTPLWNSSATVDAVRRMLGVDP